jgi:hypothetical protein
LPKPNGVEARIAETEVVPRLKDAVAADRLKRKQPGSSDGKRVPEDRPFSFLRRGDGGEGRLSDGEGVVSEGKVGVE